MQYFFLNSIIHFKYKVLDRPTIFMKRKKKKMGLNLAQGLKISEFYKILGLEANKLNYIYIYIYIYTSLNDLAILCNQFDFGLPKPKYTWLNKLFLFKFNNSCQI